MIISWDVKPPKFSTLWETVVSAYENQKNRKAVAAEMTRRAREQDSRTAELTQKQLDKMIQGTEGRQLAVRRFEDYLDSITDEERIRIMDFLDWKYRVPTRQKQENIGVQVKGLMEEVHRLLNLHEKVSQ